MKKETKIIGGGDWIDFAGVRVSNHTKDRVVVSLEERRRGEFNVYVGIEGTLRKMRVE